MATLNWQKKPDIPIAAPRPPKFDIAELDGIVPQSLSVQYDVREVIARLVDASELDEFKKLYGTTVVTGFARIEGMPVGIIANNGILFSKSRSRPRTSSSSVASAASRCCSCKTFRASWWARNTRRVASPRMAPSW